MAKGSTGVSKQFPKIVSSRQQAKEKEVTIEVNCNLSIRSEVLFSALGFVILIASLRGLSLKGFTNAGNYDRMFIVVKRLVSTMDLLRIKSTSCLILQFV